MHHPSTIKNQQNHTSMAAFGEQIRNAIIQPFSISITYHYPFTFSVEMHSTFVIVNESFSVESCSLQDEVRYIRLIFPFFDSPFSSKGKRRKRGWRIEADDWHLRPIFSSFTANSLNRIMRIWVRLKRHHRRNRAKTILFFHSYDRKCTVVKSRQNPASSYIQLSSLAMFSLQSVKMSC